MDESSLGPPEFGRPGGGVEAVQGEGGASGVGVEPPGMVEGEGALIVACEEAVEDAGRGGVPKGSR